MNANLQSILIRRKSKISFNPQSNMVGAPTGYVGAILANIAELGYVLDNKLIHELQWASAPELENFYFTILPLIKNQIGYVNHKPMYPNFPKQVAEAAYEELWINAVMHYFGDVIGTRILPEYEKEIRFPFCELSRAKWIGLATFDDVIDCFKSLLESKASPSHQDKSDIDTFFECYTYYPSWMDTIQFNNKEVLAYVCSKHPFFMKYLKTATDVLRIIVAQNNGDVSLAKNTKFGKMSRSQRRNILSILDKMNPSSVEEDMKRHCGMWIRLGEKLHPSEYIKQFPNIAEAFRKLRNNEISTFNSKIELGIKCNEYYQVIALLKTRPGDFARRLNALLSKSSDKFAVMEAFKSVGEKVSTPVLWQLYGYFKGHDALCSFNNRLFIPKGQTSKAIKSENNLKPIARGYTVGMVQIIKELLSKKYSEKESLIDNTVYIDPICKNLLIPTGNRSASTALRQAGRGSRFKIGNSKSTVRLFVYWKDQKNTNNTNHYYNDDRVDLDLSAVMFDKDWKSLGQCSWTNLRNGSGDNATMVHSGDITSAPNGASEFIDLNLDKLGDDVAYIACNVFCYTGQKMKDLKVAFMGWMEREYAGSGEIYEPKSVEGRCDLTADATSTCPLILDVKNREIIWADLSITLDGFGYCTENTIDSGTATAQLISRMTDTRASLYDMFKLNVLSRGATIVLNYDKDYKPDIVIAEDGDINPFNISEIMSDWV